MSTDFSPVSVETCDNCGNPVQNGDLVYQGCGLIIHDECFLDYFRRFVMENGWQLRVYGGEDLD